VRIPERQKLLDFSVLAMRISLGIIFLWFGALKLSGNNPVYDLVYASFPFLADGIGNLFLSLLEVMIGILLLINAVPRLTHIVLLLHLAGTFATFITAPSMMFHPYFPILTFEGEFVVKNLTLALGGIIVLLYQEK
jgi:putative oxidoreductase